MVKARGTVQFIELEGGFYGIVTDDGKKYLPLTLGEPFQQDGLRVAFTARVRNDMASIYMWGTLVEIVEIEKL